MKTIISFIGLLLISVLFPVINLIVNIYVFIVAVFIKKKDPAKYLWFHYLEFDRYSASAHAHLWNDVLVQKDATYRFEEGNNPIPAAAKKNTTAAAPYALSLTLSITLFNMPVKSLHAISYLVYTVVELCII